MNTRIPFILIALVLSPLAAAQAETLTLTAPLDYQIIQRQSKAAGTITISGSLTAAPTPTMIVEARIVTGAKEGEWQKLTPVFTGKNIDAALPAPAGGWFRVEVRLMNGSDVIASAGVEHVGVGEIFVVAGQSNSANFGEEKQKTQTGRVAAFDGKHWRLAHDPQPGAGGNGGSFMPPLGDALVQRFDVPVGFIACGIGATSVREWLPKGTQFPNPPSREHNVTQLPGGQWESKGGIFTNFVDRMKQPGLRGFRAVLWHQGESDANQKDKTRTLTGPLYHDYLKLLITESRHAIGWDAPWFVALASYHTPGDEGSPDIRAAQTALWKEGAALEGPDSDALKGTLRQDGGKGVHFSGPGLREHAAKWAEKITPWLEQQLAAPPEKVK